MKLIIDARMINHSGIGTYLKKQIPLIYNSLGNQYEIVLIGERDILIKEFSTMNVIIYESNAKIYSIKEQFLFLKLRNYKNESLLWIPHINIPLIYNGKLFVTVHDVFHLAYYKHLHIKQKIYIKLVSFFFRKNVLKVLTVSNFSKNEIIKYLKINRHQITVTHNGVDEYWKSEKTLRLTNINNPYFIYVGNVKPHKNLKNLVKAFSMIKDKISHDLIIVGKKDGFITGDEEVIKMADSMNDRVKFTGFLKDEELRQYVNEAEAMVFPSFYEGFGLPPLEAMAAGTPVIASNAASIPEVCGDAALYFDPYSPEDIAEKIMQFVSNKNLQQELREKGLKRSELFSWEKCADETIRVIKEVIGE